MQTLLLPPTSLSFFLSLSTSFSCTIITSFTTTNISPSISLPLSLSYSISFSSTISIISIIACSIVTDRYPNSLSNQKLTTDRYRSRRSWRWR